MYRLLLSVLLISLICCKGSVEPILSTNQKIAFVSYRDDGGEIYIMNDEGSNQTRLTNSSAYIPQCVDCNSDPQFSPDGSKIIITSIIDRNSEIYIMNQDGNDQTNISKNQASDYLARFSPDGLKIVFMSDRDGNEEIYRMNHDGSDQTNLSNNPAPDLRPQYSPDGSKIAFGSYNEPWDIVLSILTTIVL